MAELTILTIVFGSSVFGFLVALGALARVTSSCSAVCDPASTRCELCPRASAGDGEEP